MKMSKLTLVFAVIAISTACTTTNYNEKQIIGRWFSQEWLRDGQDTGMTAWFEFNDDKTYRAVIARTQEEGRWWIEGNKLFTQANGAEKIVVKIEKLDNNQLQIGMNRSGQKEEILFAPGYSKTIQ